MSRPHTRIASLADLVPNDRSGSLVVTGAGGYLVIPPGDPLFSTATMVAVAWVREGGRIEKFDHSEEETMPDKKEVRNVIVADIDGCCIFSEHRIPFLLEGDEDTYHQNHIFDKPIAPGVAVYQKFVTDQDYRFYFVTARKEGARQYTLNQLRTWIHPDIRDDQLLMRPDDAPYDEVHATRLKPALLRAVGVEPYHIFLVFEDQTSMVKTWRKQGVVVYQTAFGDF